MANRDPIAPPLTKAALSAPPLPAPGKRLHLWDSTSTRGGVKGLALRVTSTGAGAWYVVYRLEDKQVWYRLGAAREKDGTVRCTLSTARARAKAHLAAVAGGEDPRAVRDARRAAVRGDGTLAAILDLYWTDHLQHTRSGDETKRRVKQVFGTLLDKKLTDISEIDIARFRRARLAKVTLQSWNRDYTVLRALYSWAEKHGHVVGCPLKPHHKASAVDDSRVRWLGQHDPLEEQRLLDALERQPGYMRTLVKLALLTGCRRGELFDLTWGAVDLDRAQLTVEAHTAKAAKKRVVPLPVSAVKILEAWKPKDAKPSDRVIPSPVNGQRLVTVKKAWRTLCREAKVNDFRLHDCRHNYASRLVMGGADIFTVSKLLGHADPKITADRYAHLSDEHKLDVVRKVFG